MAPPTSFPHHPSEVRYGTFSRGWATKKNKAQHQCNWWCVPYLHHLAVGNRPIIFLLMLEVSSPMSHWLLSDPKTRTLGKTAGVKLRTAQPWKILWFPLVDEFWTLIWMKCSWFCIHWALMFSKEFRSAWKEEKAWSISDANLQVSLINHPIES